MRAFGLLFVGVLFSQALMAVLPIALARLLSPSEMGIIAGITTLVGILAGIAHGRYATIISIADDERDAQSLMRTAIWLSLLSGVVFMAALGILWMVDLIPQVRKWSPWIFFVPLWSVTSAVGLAKSEYLIFKKEYQTFSLVSIAKSAVTLLLHLPIFWFSGILFPLLAKTFGELVAWKSRSGEGLLSFRETIKKYRHYSVHDVPMYMMSLISKNIIFFSVGFFFTIETLGLFSIAYKVFRIPLSLLGETLSKVIQRKLKGAETDPGRFRQIVLKGFFALTLASFVLGVGIRFFTRPLFEVFFDQRWMLSVDFVIKLLPAMVAQLVVIPHQCALKVGRHMKILSIGQALQSVLVILSIGYGVYTHNALDMVWGYSLAIFISQGYILVRAFRVYQ